MVYEGYGLRGSRLYRLLCSHCIYLQYQQCNRGTNTTLRELPHRGSLQPRVRTRISLTRRHASGTVQLIWALEKWVFSLAENDTGDNLKIALKEMTRDNSG